MVTPRFARSAPRFDSRGRRAHLFRRFRNVDDGHPATPTTTTTTDVISSGGNSPPPSYRRKQNDRKQRLNSVTRYLLSFRVPFPSTFGSVPVEVLENENATQPASSSLRARSRLTTRAATYATWRPVIQVCQHAVTRREAPARSSGNPIFQTCRPGCGIHPLPSGALKHQTPKENS